MALELVLADRRRFPLDAELSIGRSRASTVQLADPSVSRIHARIRPGGGGDAVLEDAGSTYGTWLDGRRVDAPTPLRAGARIRVGEQELVVARRPGDAEAGATIVVPTADGTTRLGGSPRLRTGYALKRLEAAEGDRRWVLKDLRKTCATYYDERVPESSIEILGHSPLCASSAAGIQGDPHSSAAVGILVPRPRV